VSGPTIQFVPYISAHSELHAATQDAALPPGVREALTVWVVGFALVTDAAREADAALGGTHCVAALQRESFLDDVLAYNSLNAFRQKLATEAEVSETISFATTAQRGRHRGMVTVVDAIKAAKP
jgi:hypothetical protein